MMEHITEGIMAHLEEKLGRKLSEEGEFIARAIIEGLDPTGAPDLYHIGLDRYHATRLGALEKRNEKAKKRKPTRKINLGERRKP